MKGVFPPDTVLIFSDAQLPKNTGIYEKYKLISVGLLIDKKTSQIIDCDVTTMTDLARSFLRDMVCGYFLNQGIEPLLSLLRERGIGPSAGAFHQALKICYEKYLEICKN